MTNTAGEVQLVRKGGDVMGPRTDFDILRILSHQLAQHGLGQPSVCARPRRLSMKFASRCRVRRLMATLMLGEAERTSPASSR